MKSSWQRHSLNYSDTQSAHNSGLFEQNLSRSLPSQSSTQSFLKHVAATESDDDSDHNITIMMTTRVSKCLYIKAIRFINVRYNYNNQCRGHSKQIIIVQSYST